MTDREALLYAIEPVLNAVRGVNIDDPDDALRLLNHYYPLHGHALTELRKLVRAGVEAGWLCDREANGVRYCRLSKPTDLATKPFSIDVVHMNDVVGPGHEHGLGEVDLCFPVSGEPLFDGRPPGWTVYPSGSWHEPTVTGGAMDILYFLPNGAIRFGPKA